MVLPPNPYIENRLLESRSSFLCGWLGHKYKTISIEKHSDYLEYHTDKCSRCGNIETTVTIGPLNFIFMVDKDDNK